MDPLADLVDWIALYGILGLFSIGLAERFVPVLPSYGVLVAIGIAANNDVWSIHTAVLATTMGSFVGALTLYALVLAFGKQRSASMLYAAGTWVGLSRQRIDLTISSLRGREQSIAVTSQLIPTVRLVSPLAAGLMGTGIMKFASGLAVGIVSWNGLFIGAGYLAVTLLPGINASVLALKTLLVLIAVEAVSALVFRLHLRYAKRLGRAGNAR
ncbi:VTT domain-containing protein [Neorhizobium sp. Rsf11]|uniref:VTT domain-containing protein n=2 Tax=Neorhizobium TaxID=1525371 RepID=A0ABV0M2I8_9HYPH|nr:VTT domain-containing protein [Neorhizobium petrolearium]MCC2612149.1 VTT domain-containing protein [Neorhizobium petrolearium]WGI67300.1 VTT domain-containing protein [Neorhizobium petrolearium]